MTSDTRKERKGVTDEEKNANKPKKKKKSANEMWKNKEPIR